METTDSYCGYCKIRFTGPCPASQHYASSKHKVKVAAFSSAMPAAQADPTAITGLGGPPLSEVQPQAMQAEESLHRRSPASEILGGCIPGGPPDKTFTFDIVSGRGYCNLCRLDFTSQQHANQHLNGKNHKKKERIYQFQSQVEESTVNPMNISRTLNPPPGFPPLNVFSRSLTTAGVVTKAVGAERRSDLVDLTPTSSDGMISAAGTSALSTDDRNLLGLRTLGSSTTFSTSQPVLAAVNQPAPHPLSLSAADATEWKICPVCKKKVNSEQLLKLHMASHSPTQSTIEEKTEVEDGMVMVDGVPWWKCGTCDKKMNTEEQLNLHKNSPAHLKKVETNATLGVLGPSADRTVWQLCSVCQKKLNSPQQLKMHLKSHGLPESSVEQLMLASAEVSTTQLISVPIPNTSVSVATQRKSRFDHSGFYKANLDDITIVKTTQDIKGKEVAKKGTALLLKSEALPSTPALQEIPASRLSQPVPTQRPFSALISAPPVTVPIRNLSAAPKVDILTDQLLEDTCPEIKNLSSEFESLNLISFDDPPKENKNPPASGSSTSPQQSKEGLDTWEQDPYITEGLCDFPNCAYHCQICDKHLSGKRPMEDHVDSTGHEKKKSSLNGCEMYHHCPVCDIMLNTQKDYRSHVRGKQHRAKMVRKQVAPLLDLPPCSRTLDMDTADDTVYSLAQTVPRAYQAELYLKIMTDKAENTVCYLPTGTGKTLVATLVIGQMLTMNPRHNVLFLVDRVLLVLQQAAAIRRELKDLLPGRWASETESICPRPVRVAALCGGQQDIVNDDMAPWQHDVIVATAGYYQNLLEYEAVRWNQHCLVVIDEVHHSVQGGHPFQVLLNKNHLTLSQERRPKILGLTASPAGMESVSKTQAMLRKLMHNLGGAKIVSVSEEVKELERYQGSTQLVPRLVALSTQEEELEELVKVYLKACFEEIKQRSNLENLMKEVGDPSLDNLREDFSLPSVDELLYLLNEITVTSSYQLITDALVMHTKIVCNGYSALEQFGVASAFFELSELQKENLQESFTIGHQLKLPFEPLQGWLQRKHEVNKFEESDRETDAIDGPMLTAIVDEITSAWDRKAYQQPMILVLVKRRNDAKMMANILEKSPELQQRKITITHIVGHGNGGCGDGMSVTQQSRRLGEITKGQHNVIVATSVAEEGVDLPACELVIQCDVPSSVTALVQIRGRARKSRSRFVVMCRHNGQTDDLKDLLERENIMAQAINDMVAEETRC